MNKFAEYIQQIEIKALWGRKNIVWNLRPDVNILSGINGIGKSTILNESVRSLNVLDNLPFSTGKASVKMIFHPEDATAIRFDVIRSFDRPLLHAELLEKMADKHVKTELDWQLYQLQRRYLDYQVNVGNRIIEKLTSGTPDGQTEAALLSMPKKMFQDMVDELFSETGKHIVRQSNEIMFEQDGDTLHPYQLSSGEKQLLVILLTVLVQDGQPSVLFMDEPEVSLHIEWQQRLIELIRRLNHNVQIILTTHSPAVIMNGWMAAGLSQEDAGTATSCTLVLISALLTGLNLYNKIARFGGAGTLVPITGFANSVVSPAIDFKSEGFITGMAAKMFIVAGPVIVFGTLASVLYGIALMLLQG